MNNNLSFDLTFTANKQNFELTINLTLYSNDDIRDTIRDEADEDEYFEDDNFDFYVSDWGDTPNPLQDLEIMQQCIEETEYYDEDIIASAIEADIQPSDINECYSGSFDSDADFAQDMAEQLGDIDNNNWLHRYIDWDWASKDLMMDYTEMNGHYFRII